MLCVAVHDDDFRLFQVLKRFGLSSQEVVGDLLQMRLDDYLKENDISKEEVIQELKKGIKVEHF